MKRRAIFLGAVLLAAAAVTAREPNRFTFAQLRYKGDHWDPTPRAWEELRQFLTTTTSIIAEPERKLVTWQDPALFKLPFLYVTGSDAFPPLGERDAQLLRRYVAGGGFIWVDDAFGVAPSRFEKSVKGEFLKAFPDRTWEKLDPGHAVFFAFYLTPKPVGLKDHDRTLDGIIWGGRTAVIFTRNHLLGAWERDRVGQWRWPCVPGGEPQRLEATKMTANLLLFALTGTYKLDAIHSPFIQEKMKGQP